jgi:hypothetical protein
VIEPNAECDRNQGGRPDKPARNYFVGLKMQRQLNFVIAGRRQKHFTNDSVHAS